MQSIWELSVLFFQFSYKSKSVLKNKVLFKNHYSICWVKSTARQRQKKQGDKLGGSWNKPSREDGNQNVYSRTDEKWMNSEYI